MEERISERDGENRVKAVPMEKLERWMSITSHGEKNFIKDNNK